VLSNLLDNEIVPAAVIARRRIGEIEVERFGDIDAYEGEYVSEYDSESEHSGSAGYEEEDAGPVFLAALARMGRGRRRELVVDRSVASTVEPGQQGQEQLREDPSGGGAGGGGGWWDNLVRLCIADRWWILLQLVLAFLFYLVGYYSFNQN